MSSFFIHWDQCIALKSILTLGQGLSLTKENTSTPTAPAHLANAGKSSLDRGFASNVEGLTWDQFYTLLTSIGLDKD